ncbi:hypothetical protein MtrunA17_Chr7g0229501 [Medicago truncatula]|uniref:Transmembrane protein n=1 Tax=Medicago truncatula TaxID=3880 RepID=A0A396GXY4_MEDTR|nr:hypothetical protein MtrunA17_Chr7g0229501 [Medicago truncatula]
MGRRGSRRQSCSSLFFNVIVKSLLLLGGNLDLKHMKRDIDIDKDSKNECHLSVLYCLTEWDLVQSSVCFCFIWLLCICISCFLRLSFYGCGDLEGCGDVLDLDLRKMKRCIC